MICGNCGTELSDETKFCYNCGNPIPAPAFGDFHEKDQQSQQSHSSSDSQDDDTFSEELNTDEPEEPKKKNKLPLIIAGAVAAVILILVGIFVIPKLMSGDESRKPGKTGNRGTEASDSENDNLDEDTDEYQIASIIEEAEALAAQEDYNGALSKVQAGLEAYPDSQALQDKETAYTEALNLQIKENNLEEAQAMADSGDYVAAMELIKNAQEAQPEDEDYRDTLIAYTSTYVANAIESADALASDGEYIAALDAIEEATQVVGENDELTAKAAEYENAYVEDVTGKVDALLMANDIDGAKAIAQSAKNELPDNQAIQSLVDGLNQYRVIPLSSLTPTNGSFEWNEGTAADPFENDYSALQNYVILHSNYSSCSGERTCAAEYQVNKNYDTLDFTIVPYSDFGQNGWSYVRVYADGVLHYTSDKITQKTQPYTISVDISGAEYIKIIIYLDGYSCTMLTDVTLTKLPNYVSTHPSGYTSLGLLSFFNGSLPWENAFPCNTLGAEYKGVHNYAILHSQYSSCSGDKTYFAEYYVNKQYSTLSFDIAPYEDFQSSGSAVAKVYVDDVLVYTSPTITQKTERFNTGDIDLSQATYVKIVVEVEGYSCTILSDALLKNKD